MAPHSIFGWSYPAGCSGPDATEPYVSEFSEEACRFFEDHGVSQEYIDKIMVLIDEWERDLVRRLDEAQNAAEVERQRLANEPYDDAASSFPARA
jgi:hypothetical protein